MNYSAQKVPQLQQLCKDRGLATTGKKAELVERLEQNDASDKAAPVEDEIDWDEEPAADKAATANSVPSADAAPATDAADGKSSKTVSAQDPADAPAKSDETAASLAPNAVDADETNKKEEELAKFSTGLASRTLDEEIEKRKARARKFGMPEDSDEIKALERAKKFGGTDLPGFLNSALPEKADRKRGSGTEHDGGIRKKGRGRGPRGKALGNGDREQPRAAAGKEGGYPGWMTKGDREAAEKRKAKFATAT